MAYMKNAIVHEEKAVKSVKLTINNKNVCRILSLKAFDHSFKAIDE